MSKYIADCRSCGAQLEGDDKILACPYCGTKTEVEQTPGKAAAESAEGLAARGFLFLEEKDFAQAGEYFERALDIDPNSAQPYIGKMLAERGFTQEGELADSAGALEKDRNFELAMRFGTEAECQQLRGYAARVNERLAKEYLAAEKKAAEYKQAEVENRKKTKKLIAILLAVLGGIVVAIVIFFNVAVPAMRQEAERQRIAAEQRQAEEDYAQAETYLQSGQIQEAKQIYRSLPDGFKEDERNEAVYARAEELMQSGRQREALELYRLLPAGYQGIDKKAAEAGNRAYAEGDYETAAIAAFSAGDPGLFERLGSRMQYAYDGLVLLKSDGKTEYMGSEWDSTRQEIGQWEDIAAVRANQGFIVAGITENGTVEQTGFSSFRGLDEVIAGWTDIRDICIVFHNLIGLRNDGTVVAADKEAVSLLYEGRRIYEEYEVEDWSGITQISAADANLLGLRNDGTAVGTGTNLYGETEVQDWEGITKVVTKTGYSAGLKEDGTVVAAGQRKYGIAVGEWSDIVDIGAMEDAIAGLTGDGTVLSTESRYHDKLHNKVAMFCGDYWIAGIDAEGTVEYVGAGAINPSPITEPDVVAVDIYYDGYKGQKAEGTQIALLKADGKVLTFRDTKLVELADIW